MLSKRRDAPYRSGQVESWVKAKCILRCCVVIIGYQLGGYGGLGAIHVASDEGGSLNYVGSVGTGFSDLVARELKAHLDAITQSKPVVLSLTSGQNCSSEPRSLIATSPATAFSVMPALKGWHDGTFL
jgi:bifunctional non-homologous end joining protein LigD